jgi:cytochrome c
MPSFRRPLAVLLSVGVVVAVVAVLAGGGVQYVQGRQARIDKAQLLTGGDVARGEAAIGRNGCGSCHTIPGVQGAKGLSGPPLTKLGSRVYIAGKFDNTPANLVRWVQHPQAMDPGVAMPEMGLTEQQARDVAAYLYTIN